MYDIDGVNVTRRSPRVNGADITWPAIAFRLKIVMVHETQDARLYREYPWAARPSYTAQNPWLA